MLQLLLIMAYFVERTSMRLPNTSCSMIWELPALLQRLSVISWLKQRRKDMLKLTHSFPSLELGKHLAVIYLRYVLCCDMHIVPSTVMQVYFGSFKTAFEIK